MVRGVKCPAFFCLSSKFSQTAYCSIVLRKDLKWATFRLYIQLTILQNKIVTRVNIHKQIFAFFSHINEPILGNGEHQYFIIMATQIDGITTNCCLYIWLTKFLIFSITFLHLGALIIFFPVFSRLICNFEMI